MRLTRCKIRGRLHEPGLAVNPGQESHGVLPCILTIPVYAAEQGTYDFQAFSSRTGYGKHDDLTLSQEQGVKFKRV